MILRPLHSWPTLDDPFLLVALQGWVDAGSSAQLAATAIRRGWDMRRIAVADSDAVTDYQHRRPQVRLDEDGRRRIVYQDIEVLLGRAGNRDALLLTGPEPARKWPSFIADTVAMAKRFGVNGVYMLGGLPAPIPHTHELPVAMSVNQPAGPDGFDMLIGTYEGPTGLQTALQVGFGDAGLPAVALWVQIPHYLAAMAWPAGAIALVKTVGSLASVPAPTGELGEADKERRRQVEEVIAERPDVQSLVSALEEGIDGERIPSGDEIADEIERFLAGGDSTS